MPSYAFKKTNRLTVLTGSARMASAVGVAGAPGPVRRALRHVGGCRQRGHLPLPLDCVFFFFNDTATTEIYALSLHDALPISPASHRPRQPPLRRRRRPEET